MLDIVINAFSRYITYWCVFMDKGFVCLLVVLLTLFLPIHTLHGGEVIIIPDTDVTLTLPLGYYVDKLNPVSSILLSDIRILDLLFDPLMLNDPFHYSDMSADIPWVLREEPIFRVVYNETYGNNVTVCTIKLRENIRFFDGVEMTSEDIVFTLDFLRWASPESLQEFIDTILDYWSTDKYTVKIVFNVTGIRPKMFIHTMRIFPKHIYEKAEVWGGTEGVFPNWDVYRTMVLEHRATSPDDPVLTGYGPFILTGWEPENAPCNEATMFILKRNPHYFMRAVDENGTVVWEWHELTKDYVEQYGADAFRGPYIEELRYKVIVEDVDMYSELFVGSIDMGVAKTLPPCTALTEAGFKMVYASSPYVSSLMINVRGWPLNESAFRRALSYAIDKRRVCQLVYSGWAMPLDSIVPRCLEDWSLEYVGLKPLCFLESDLEKALNELKELNISDIDSDGWLEKPDGSEISIEIKGLDTPIIRNVVGVVADSIEELGIHVNTVFENLSVVYLCFHESSFELMYQTICTSLIPVCPLEYFASWGVLSTITGWSNDDYDEAIKNTFYREAKWEEIYHSAWQAQIIILEESPIIPICEHALIGVYRPANNSTNGWIGVFEKLPGAPVVNRYTILKATKIREIVTPETSTPNTNTTTGNMTTNRNPIGPLQLGHSIDIFHRLLISFLLVPLIIIVMRKKKKRTSTHLLQSTGSL